MLAVGVLTDCEHSPFGPRLHVLVVLATVDRLKRPDRFLRFPRSVARVLGQSCENQFAHDMWMRANEPHRILGGSRSWEDGAMTNTMKDKPRRRPLYPAEVRERGVHMVMESEADQGS